MHEPAGSLIRQASLPVTSPMTQAWRRRVFPGRERELGQVRQWLVRLLPDCSARDDVLSVATELATNAIEHTASGEPGGTFAVEVSWQASLAQVVVADGGSQAEPREICDPDGERGRGLLLVRRLAARTGWTGDRRGRLVWAQIAWPDGNPAITSPADDPCQAASRALGVTAVAGGDHLSAWCCCHVFTPACPVDCLAAVLSTATFHVLARAERAPFDPPATVGQVLDLCRTGQLVLAVGLGPRRLSEIKAALVLAGLPLSGPGS